MSITTPQAKTKDHTSNNFLSRKRLFSILIGLVVIIAVFWSGYQLAFYQIEKNDNEFPHFNFNQNNCYNEPDYSSFTNNDSCGYPNQGGGEVLDKPVIYLYPTHTERVDVKLLYPAGLKLTVPTYNSSYGWQVVAQPGGVLTNLADSKNYPYLFWEGNPPTIHFDMTKGFVVSGNKTKDFLQDQLMTMGLNENETNEFISYWLPRMENNPYNLIHFAGSEFTDYSKLMVTPKPDSLLQVIMVFEPLPAPIKVAPQTFPTFHRVGFTVVEWGGTELNS